MNIGRHNHIILYLFLVILLSCGKDEDEIYYNIDGVPYPNGIKDIDLTTYNDCTLSRCDTNRITRLELKNVVGTLRLDSILQVSFTSDSYIEFHICNQSSLAFDFSAAQHKKVKFSGTARDACGYLYTGYPFEEEYFIELTKIQLL